MKEQTIPLVGSMTARNVNPDATLSTKDQIFSGVLFDVIKNPVTGSGRVYANKRPGVKTGTTIASGENGRAICENHGFDVLSGPCTVYSFASVTNREVYVSTTQVGVIQSVSARHTCEITQATISGEEHYLISYPGTTEGGFFVNETGMSGGTTFTGDTTSGNADILNVSSTTGLVVGQALFGTGIATAARISNISGSTVTMTLAATATNAGVTVTRERMARIISANFPSKIIGPMHELDGYIFVAEQNSQKIYHSDINSIQNWSATSFISANATVGKLLGISRLGQEIVAITTDSTQFFYNSGNAVGSVLSRNPTKTKRSGGIVDAGSAFAGTIAFRPFSAVDDYLFIMHEEILLLTAGGSQQVVSTPVVSKLLKNASKSTISFDAFKMLGKVYLYVSTPITATPSFSLIYDLTANLWSFTGFSKQYRFGKHLGYCVNNETFGDGALGYWPFVGTAQTPAYQDHGSSYTMKIQTDSLDFGTNRKKFIPRIDLIGADIQSSGTATLEISTDDFATFRTLGTFDLTKINPFITRCGSFKGSASFRLTHSANTAFRAEALKVWYEVGNA